MFYEISGLLVEVQGDEYLNERMAEYQVRSPISGGRICDLRIINRLKTQIEKPQGQEVTHSLFWKLVQTNEGQSLYRNLPGFEDIVSARIDFNKNGADISVLKHPNPETLEIDDERMFRFAGHSFGHILLNHQRLVLHGSCIRVNGKAIIFSAPSGTGKSTHTNLWMENVDGVEFINDDTPVIRLDKGEAVYACGSPWSGKTQLNSNISAPLAAIVLLERGVENKIERVGNIEAFARVLGEIRKFAFKESIEASVSLCEKLITRVPVYKLSCNISSQAVETVREELML